MSKFKVKIKPFKSKNKGGVPHMKLHQPESQRQQMLVMTENLIKVYNKLTSTHHKKPLPAVGLDGERTQAWHIKQLSRNTSGRKEHMNHLIYEADVLRHNAVLEDLLKQLGKKGNTTELLNDIRNELYIELDEDKPLSSANLFNKLAKFQQV
jgi:hypothetical protein